MKSSLLAALLLLLMPMAFACLAAADGPGMSVTVDSIDCASRDVLDEINAARTDPAKYAGYLREWKKLYDGRRVWLSKTYYLQMQEDASAVDEAIRFLKKQKPVGPLTRSEGLERAAREHVDKQGAAGQTGHVSPDGLSMSDRVGRCGTWQKTIGENISYGTDDPRRIVMLWIIDDGVPGRGHRANLFNPDFKVAGAAVGPHKVHGTVCVVDMAGGFEPSE
ncbi:MAG: CAP domain-containing protein [Nitrospirae bacterium]|nr:CAP domain-containing protein [Nitrospirota bacterium]